MGLKIRPSTPCMVNKGTNAATVIRAENKIAISTCRALARISRNRSVQWGALVVPATRRVIAKSPSASCCSRLCRSAGCWKFLKIFSIRITAEFDDDAEVDRADREQVGILPHQNHDDDGEKQREWYINADDDGAAQIAEEHPLDDENQKQPKMRLCSTVWVVTSTSELRS